MLLSGQALVHPKASLEDDVYTLFHRLLLLLLRANKQERDPCPTQLLVE